MQPDVFYQSPEKVLVVYYFSNYASKVKLWLMPLGRQRRKNLEDRFIQTAAHIDLIQTISLISTVYTIAKWHDLGTQLAKIA